MSGPEFVIPWLKLIPVFLAFTGGIADFVYERRKTREAAGKSKRPKPESNKWRQYFLPALLIGTALANATITIRDTQDTEQTKWETELNRTFSRRRELFLRKDAEKARRDATMQLDQISGKLGIAAGTDRYIAAIRALNDQILSQQTSNAVDILFNTQEERKKLREQVKEVNDRLILIERQRIEPIYNLIIQKYDLWVSELQKRGLKTKVETREIPPVQGPPQRWESVRLIRFGETAVAFIQIYPLIVEEGKSSRHFITQSYTIAKDGSQEGCFSLYVYDDRFEFTNNKTTRYSFSNMSERTSDPITDGRLVTEVNKAIDQMMAHVVDQVGTR